MTDEEISESDGDSGTSAAKAMAAVVKSVTKSLKARGFTKRRHAFNRIAEPGLVHVVDFQMGAYSPAAHEARALPSLYGRFTVNLGVFVSEVYEATQRCAAPPFVAEHSCEFRARLGQLMTPPGDTWWPLDGDVARVATEIENDLRVLGEPWLAIYASRDAIVRIPDLDPAPVGWPLHPEIALAVMHAKRGARSEAQSLFSKHLAASSAEPEKERHREWVPKIARRLGFADAELI